jgi:membrane-bound serine protease (ClpP class)
MVEGIAILIVFVVAVAVLLWKWFVLIADERTEAGYIATGKHDALVGKEGVAHTPLRPSGTGLIDGRRVNVAADGEFIEKDSPIRVIEVEGNRIVVCKAEDAGRTRPRLSRTGSIG